MSSPDWAPSPADVGAILRTRTKDRNGNEPGTFNSDTRPTGDSAADLIDTIVTEIAADCGAIPDLIQDYARRTAAMGTAAEVELTYWPEQSSRSGSTYDRLYARYQDMFTRLKKQVSEVNADGTVTDDEDLLPVFAFPQADPCDPNAFVGWASRF